MKQAQTSTAQNAKSTIYDTCIFETSSNSLNEKMRVFWQIVYSSGFMGLKKKVTHYTRLPIIMIDMLWINSDVTSKKKFEIFDDNEL